MVIAALLSEWVYGTRAHNAKASDRDIPPDRQYLPPGLMCPEGGLHCANATAGGQGRVQYALVHAPPAAAGAAAGARPLAYLVFRGTKDPFDWTINVDLSCVRMPSADGLRVHNGMLGALQDTSSGEPVLDVLAAMLHGRSVVVCGHSLGGGMALIAAAHLLNSGVDVQRVFAFGAPMVIAGDQCDHPIWALLHERTVCLVHDCDIVPRTMSPTALSWVFEMVPEYLLNTMFGWVTNLAGVKKQVADFVERLKHNKDAFCSFGACGTTFCFLTSGNFGGRRVSFEQDGSIAALHLDQVIPAGGKVGVAATLAKRGEWPRRAVDVVEVRDPCAAVRLLGYLCDDPAVLTTTSLKEDHSMVSNYLMCALCPIVQELRRETSF